VTPGDQQDPRERSDAGTDPAGKDDAATDRRVVDEKVREHGVDEPDWVRRRRLDAVFGGGEHGQPLGDRWYRDQVPPHHG
jgi:hypothetical protein